MKQRWKGLLGVVLPILFLFSACKPSLNDVIATKPCKQGVVESVYEQSILLAEDKAEGDPNTGGLYSVSLDVEYSDSMTNFYEGDRVAVYYDGGIAESFPGQINDVYAILLLEAGDARKEAEKEQGAGQNADGYTEITPEAAKEMMDADPDAVILDVREQNEFDAGHIEGAVLLPVGTISEESAAALLPDKETTVLVYCRSGNRSKQAAKALAELGYTQIYEFGGINDWPYGLAGEE